MKKFLVIMVIVLSCSPSEKENYTIDKNRLLTHGFEVWELSNIYYKKKDSLTVFYTLNESNTVRKRHVMMDLQYFKKELSALKQDVLNMTSENKPVLFNKKTNNLYEIDTVSRFVSLTQVNEICNSLELEPYW